jgi:hypothetical protein
MDIVCSEKDFASLHLAPRKVEGVSSPQQADIEGIANIVKKQK